jgi:cephalosporin hydroxylase
MTLNTQVRGIIRPLVGEDRWVALRARRGQIEYRARKLRKRSRQLQQQLLLTREQRADARQMRTISTDLTQLATHFRTDKWGAHRYAQHYQRHLSHLRDKPVKVLEIGIGGYSRAKQGGASLRMWKHFFPRGKIVGLDIHDKSFVEEPRIRAYRGDQTDPALLHRIVEEAGSFDVIIDDGSHISEHIVATFGILFPLLADDGIYVVEDTQTSYWPERGGSEDLEDPSTSMSFLKRLVDGLNYEEFLDESYEPTYSDTHVVSVTFYHNLAFIQKGTNVEGTQKRNILKERYARLP